MSSIKPRNLTILVVDDDLADPDKSMKSDLEDMAGNMHGLKIHYAGTLAEARQIIRDRFFNVALVDHVLGTHLWGVDVLLDIAAVRPSSFRVIMTKEPEYAKPGAGRLFECFSLMEPTPDEPIAHRFAPKHKLPIRAHVENLAAEFGLPGLDIHYKEKGSTNPVGIDRFFAETIRPKLERADECEAKPTIEELRHVLRQVVLGTPIPGAQKCEPVWERHTSRESVESLHLEKLTGGRSRSTVMSCTPVTQAGHKCTLCVIKVSPREEALEEVARFNQYVRLHRVSARRIELLGCCVADTMGAACYSFAGDDGDGVESVRALEELLGNEDLRSIAYLNHEFSFTNREWYDAIQKEKWFSSITAKGSTLGNYFEDPTNYGIKTSKTLGDALRTLPPEITAAGPNEPEITNRLLEMGFTSCIIHGDLNAGNLLCVNAHDDDLETFATSVASDDWDKTYLSCEKVVKQRSANLSAEQDDTPSKTVETRRSTVLIDYRHTRRGPIFIDFAALQASLRILPKSIDPLPANAEDLIAWEKLVWKRGWNDTPDPANDVVSSSEANAMGFIGLVSTRMIQLARSNFENPDQYNNRLTRQDAQREYAATCLLYALRLYKISALGKDIVKQEDGTYKNLSKPCKMRLAAWIYQLACALLAAP